MTLAVPELNANPVAVAAEPLGADEFYALMRGFGPYPQATCLALAISGGPDSMALAWCMKGWAQAHGCRLVALIVDHNLRPESAVEARQTQVALTALGLVAEILRWDHPPLTSKIHLIARKARYRLLTAAALRHGASFLLTAHQREDQGETILMRLAKGSGIDGLAGIAACVQLDGLKLVRPFLATPKDRLIATCKAARLPFTTDPSNLSGRYARGRLRRVLSLLESEGLTVDRLTELAARAADARDALEHYKNALLRVASQRDAAGVLSLSLDHLRAAPRAIADRALITCLQSVHPEDYAPEQDALTRLRNMLLGETEMTPRTLHGCLIAKTATHVVIMREASAIIATLAVKPGDCVVWDKRWEISLAMSAEPCVIRALGNPPHDDIDRLAPNLRHQVPQGRVRAGLPAGWQGENLVFIPSFDFSAVIRPLAARLLNSWL
jgi:tRNA(Ile)-lysidine synthase